MKLLPIIPGCKAIVTHARYKYDPLIGTEVDVIDKCIPPKEAPEEQHWEITSPLCQQLLGEAATGVAAPESVLMRLDGNEDLFIKEIEEINNVCTNSV